MSMKFKNPIEVDGYVSAEYADLSTTTSHSVSVGEIAWNATDGTFDMGLIGGVTLQAGQEMHIYGKATEAISNGDAVMFGGVQGEHLLLSKADATTINANPEYFIGVSTQDFATNDFGYVTVFGKVRTLDTTGYSLGAVLYYDSTTSTDGKLTATEPSAPNAKIIVAAVVRVHATQGVLMVRPHIMPMLSEIQDVNTSLSKTTPVNTDNLLLQDSADQSVWKKLSWSNLKATLKAYFDTIYQSVLTNPITGTGTTNYLTRWSSSNTVSASSFIELSGKIGNVASPQGVIQLNNLSGAYGSGSPYIVNSYNGSNVFRTYMDGNWNYVNEVIQNGTNQSGFLILTNGSEKMRITKNGYVGIGTSSPNYKTVIQTANQTFGLVVTTNANDTETGFYVQPDHTNGIVKLLASGGTDKAFGFLTGNTERMRLTSAGSLGIGTTSPSSILHLNSAVPFLSIQGSTTGSLRGINIMQGTTVFSSLSAEASLGETRLSAGFSGWGGFQTFYTNGSEKMRITSAGDVGIGTSSPGAKLNIRGTDALFSVINTDGFPLIYGETDSSSQNFVVKFGETGDQYGLPYFYMDQGLSYFKNTNLGIGTSSPSVQLNVIGQVIFDDGNLGAISPEPNSILQLESDRKGFLPPRLTETQRNNIGTPVAGLMIFNKDSNYLEVYDGSNWRALAYV